MNALENFYLSKEEPIQSCLIALRDFINSCHSNIDNTWKYSMPFFEIGNKRFCYLWTDKITGHPYIGFTDGNKLSHPLLISGKRSKMKILPINPNEDLPIELIQEVVQEAIELIS